MAIFLWSLLNVVALLGLLYIFGRAVLLVREHIGLGAALLLCLGLLGFVGRRAGPVDQLGSNQNLLGPLPPGTPLGNASSVQTIPLGMFSTKIQLLAEFWIQPGALKPRGLYVIVSGLLLGHRWQALRGTLVLQGSRLHYTAVVRHDWTLLGNFVFNSTNEYAGLMPAGQI